MTIREPGDGVITLPEKRCFYVGCAAVGTNHLTIQRSNGEVEEVHFCEEHRWEAENKSRKGRRRARVR